MAGYWPLELGDIPNWGKFPSVRLGGISHIPVNGGGMGQKSVLNGPESGKNCGNQPGTETDVEEMLSGWIFAGEGRPKMKLSL